MADQQEQDQLDRMCDWHTVPRTVAHLLQPLQDAVKRGVQVVELQRLNDLAGRVALLDGVAARKPDMDMAHMSDPETILAESAAVSFGHCS